MSLPASVRSRVAKWALRTRWLPFHGYSLAFVSAVLALAIRVAADRVLAHRAPFLPFLLAVTIIARFVGRGPALLVTALSMPSVAYSFAPGAGTPFPDAAALVALFAIVSVGISIAGSHSRNSLAKLTSTAAMLEKQTRLINFSHDAIITANADRIINGWNSGAEELYGWTEAEVKGKAVHELLQTRGALLPSQIDSILCRDGRWEGELEHTAKDGRCMITESRQILVRDGRGAPLRILEINRDITARKIAEQTLLETNRLLEQQTARANSSAAEAELANMAKSAFLANMSHEIRTPMNGVIGMTGLLLDTPLTPEQRHYAEVVGVSAESLLSLINDILDVSKMGAGKLQLETLEFDLRATLEDAVEVIAIKAAEKGLELLLVIDPAVPGSVFGDPGRLRQIILNLAGNAVKFTDRGSVTIRVAVESADVSGVLLHFTVEDTGIGIPRDHLEDLFSAFMQVDASTSRKYGGTGLGLAIAKELATLMGGRIGVDSELGTGSMFWFTARFAVGRGQAPLTPFADLQGARVIVVDDHPVNRQLVTDVLNRAGCYVAAACDGESAMSMIKTAYAQGAPFDVALLDMRLPDTDGETLARRIKADMESGQLVLVMMASFGARCDASRCEAIGFAAYLTKPVRIGILQKTIALAIGRAEDPSNGGGLVTRHTAAEAERLRKRILIAEDNIINQRVAVGILKKLGFQADVVSNGREALTALAAVPYDVVLMDCQMPDMDGFEATRCIRERRCAVHDHAIPVIALTAHAMDGDEKHCLSAGMNDYVAKPIDPKRLSAVLDRWLVGQGSTNEATLFAEADAGRSLSNA